MHVILQIFIILLLQGVFMKKFIMSLSTAASLLVFSLSAFCMDPPQEQETRYVPILGLPKEMEQQIINLTVFTPKFYVLPGNSDWSKDIIKSIERPNGDIGLYYTQNLLYLAEGKGQDIVIDLFHFIAAGGTTEQHDQILEETQHANESSRCLSLEPENAKALLQHAKLMGLFNLNILELSLVCQQWKTFCDPLITSLPRMKRDCLTMPRRSSLQPPDNFKENIKARFRNITSLCHPILELITPNDFPNLTYLDLSNPTEEFDYQQWNQLTSLTHLKIEEQYVESTFVADFPKLTNLKLQSIPSIGHLSGKKLSFMALKDFTHLTLLDLRATLLLDQDHEGAAQLKEFGITVLR